LFLQGCATIYQGPDINSDGIAVLKVIDKETSISNIDGQATTSEASFAVKGRFEQELTLLPGKHQLILIHGGWREVSSKAMYELDAQKGYTYVVQSKTVGKSTALWLEDEKSKERVGHILASMNEPVIEAVPLDTYTSVYSFLPPKEPGWRVLERTYNHLLLWKEGSKEDESFIISYTDGQIPTMKNEKEFIDALEAKSSGALSERYKSIERKIDAGDPSDFCYDIFTLVEDHAPKRQSSRTDLMLVKTAYRRCRQQANPNMIGEIYISHRYYPGDEDLDFMAKARSVYSSLKYK
jgi:hypothetical protein